MASSPIASNSAPASQWDDAQLGLTAADAARRLATNGVNELPAARPRRFLRIVFEVVREPMFLLLLACGGTYLALGDAREASMLLFFVVVVLAISLVQQRKAERALDALKNLSSPRALVIRRGPRQRIPGREVVVGDVVVLSEGDRVPADGVLLQALNLRVDESLLTGESVSVRKQAIGTAPHVLRAPGGDDLACVFSGSLIVQGNALLEVLATGSDTAIGRIGTALTQVEATPTPMEQEVRRIVKRVAVCGLLLSAALAIGYGLTRGHWLEGVLIGITMAMALLPEEMPVVMTLFLSVGAWRLAKQNVLTRRVSAIEALGTTTVLCVDKTGTLTQNRMCVQRLYADGAAIELPAADTLPEIFHPLLEFGVLASHRNAFDPMELAIHSALTATLADTEHVHAQWQLVEEYPLSPELLAMSRVWHAAERAQYAIAAKGAPEAIVDLCHLDAERAATIAREVAAMAASGLRVLGVARANFEKIQLPPLQHDFDFEFLGLIGLADPIRAEAPAAVAECRRAGLRVLMITGDHPTTALNIAQQIGLDAEAGYLTGTDLNHCDGDELAARVGKVNIFCRVSPDQKLQLVRALKKNGEIVAMTGDGVNDAPAIRAAHIGIAMGARGTDVARESADLVLMDDAFSSIVDAVRMGRRIYDNLRKAITFIIAVHVPIAGLALLPLVFGWPLLLQPVHILFLQLLIDPACSIVFEAAPEDRQLMQRPPRPPFTPLFARATLLSALAQGALLLGVLALLTTWALQQSRDEASVRALVYATMMLANLGLILCNLSTQPLLQRLRTPVFLWIGLATIAALLAILLIAPLRGLFLLAPLDAGSVLLALGTALLCMAAFEIINAVAAGRGRER